VGKAQSSFHLVRIARSELYSALQFISASSAEEVTTCAVSHEDFTTCQGVSGKTNTSLAVRMQRNFKSSKENLGSLVR